MGKPHVRRRKVVIRFTSREPNDPLVFLKAVESAFRPLEIQVCIEQKPSSEAPAVVDERLEAEVADAVSRELARRNSQQTTAASTLRSPEIAKARSRVVRWINNSLKIGYKLTVKLLPIAKALKQLLK
jgi:hypothetical protein